MGSGASFARESVHSVCIVELIDIALNFAFVCLLAPWRPRPGLGIT